MADVPKEDLLASLKLVYEHEREVLTTAAVEDRDALPSPSVVRDAALSLTSSLPEKGKPLEVVTDHLLSLTKGLSNSSLSSTYFGFVTGGCTPYALLADHLVSLYDQNNSVHLPEQSIVTNVEDRALCMLLELLNFDTEKWKGRLLTTGATAGNIQGLACGREWILNQRLADIGKGDLTAGEIGLLEACQITGINQIKVLATSPHSSLVKAASVVGLGRNSCVDVSKPVDSQGFKGDIVFDFDRLEKELAIPGRASIVSVSCGEINTGHYATHSEEEMVKLRKLCEKYKAWLHVDGAFGIFTRLLSDLGPSYARIASGGAGAEFADSLAGDLHKFLNVPYDCGYFVCQHPSIQESVYQNANAAYLKTNSSSIPSPLNIGAENSRRFRGFAVYATLMGLGRQGYVTVLKNQVDLARKIAALVDKMPEYELLNGDGDQNEEGKDYRDIATIVLFRARQHATNVALTERINAQKRIYVSGTSWQGRPASRIAVSNWRVGSENDVGAVMDVLGAVTNTK